eukprot:scaffold7806_cov17-Tisochrysis_lutea.AAC.1
MLSDMKKIKELQRPSLNAMARRMFSRHPRSNGQIEQAAPDAPTTPNSHVTLGHMKAKVSPPLGATIGAMGS